MGPEGSWNPKLGTTRPASAVASPAGTANLPRMNRAFPLLLVPVLLSACLRAESPSWPAFRGPNSSGLAAGAKPPLKIGPTNGVLWQVDVPWAPSS